MSSTTFTFGICVCDRSLLSAEMLPLVLTWCPLYSHDDARDIQRSPVNPPLPFSNHSLSWLYTEPRLSTRRCVCVWGGGGIVLIMTSLSWYVTDYIS